MAFKLIKQIFFVAFFCKFLFFNALQMKIEKMFHDIQNIGLPFFQSYILKYSQWIPNLKR